MSNILKASIKLRVIVIWNEESNKVKGVAEFDAVKSLNEVIVAYEKENGELANEVHRLNEMLEQEKVGQAKLTPSYRDALYKLKDAVNIVKNKLKDIQKSKQVEKEYYEGKVIGLVDSNLIYLDTKTERRERCIGSRKQCASKVNSVSRSSIER